jgi:hypothetical protein
MPYFVRKVRNQDKYRVNFKADNGTVTLYQFDTKEEAQQKMREEIYKLVEKEKQQDLINNSDTEIDDV